MKQVRKQKLLNQNNNKIISKIQESIKLITTFNKLKKYTLDKITVNYLDIWVKRVQKQILICNRIIKNKKLPLHPGTKRRIQTILGHLKSIKKSISNHYVGLGINSSKKSKKQNMVVWENVISCFEGRVRTGVIVNLLHKDIKQYLNDCFIIFQKKIKEILKTLSIIKVNTVFCGEFVKKTGDKEITDLKYFNTKNAIIDVGTDLQTWFSENVCDKLLNKLSEFQERDSGYALQRIINLEININKLEIGNGSSYIKLPDFISKKHACINVKNNDQACFYWAIVSALFPSKKHQELPSTYPYYKSVLNTQNLQLPMPLHEISKFEKNNDISVNVYALKFGSKSTCMVVPARLTKEKRLKHVN